MAVFYKNEREKKRELGRISSMTIKGEEGEERQRNENIVSVDCRLVG